MKVDGVELEDRGRLHANGAKLVELEPVLVVQLHHLFGRATAGRVAHGVLIEGPVALVTVGNLPVLFGRVRLINDWPGAATARKTKGARGQKCWVVEARGIDTPHYESHTPQMRTSLDLDTVGVRVQVFDGMLCRLRSRGARRR